MLVKELIQHLEGTDKSETFTANFYPLFERKNLIIFHTDDEYLEIFGDDESIEVPSYIPQDIPLTNGEAIEELKTKNQDLPIILTLGNEEDDLHSSMGGVEWRDGSLYLNTLTCPEQV